jgi:hypothetical protein
MCPLPCEERRSASRTQRQRGREETAAVTKVTGGRTGCRAGDSRRWRPSGGGLASVMATAPIIKVKAWGYLGAAATFGDRPWGTSGG